MRHAARRFSLSGTAPPLRGRKVTATPYALLSITISLTAHPSLPFSKPRRADVQSSRLEAPGLPRLRSGSKSRRIASASAWPVVPSALGIVKE